MSNESILDKVITSKQAAELSQINPKAIIEAILGNLNLKEKDILTRRFGLTGSNKEPLEKIGKTYNLTRERIRQIEAAVIKKIRQSKKVSEVLNPLKKTLAHLFETYGSTMEQSSLFIKVFEAAENTKENQQILTFILEKLDDKFIRINEQKDFKLGWKLDTANLEKINTLINQLVEMFKKINKPLKLSELLKAIKSQGSEELKEVSPEIIESYLNLSANLGQNPFADFGLRSWGVIKPKRISDKIYLVLKKANKPLHFTQISELINKAKFDHKKALPQTVHNELIIDKKFVLVGRGIYALLEWGYQPGVVSDIITQVLKQAAKPLSKEEIINRVLKQRLVKKMTIYISLINKNKFKKLPAGHYTLACATEDSEQQAMKKKTEEKEVSAKPAMPEI